MDKKVLLVVYNRELKRQGIIEVFRSLIWTRKYYESGIFELHTALNTKNLKLLSEGNILSKREYVNKDGRIEKHIGEESGIVEEIEIDDMTNEITVKGRFLSSILDRRVIKGIVNYSGTTENAMRKLVMSVTALPYLELGEMKGYIEPVQFQVSYKDLYTYICKLSKHGNLGFRIRADYKRKVFYFETYQGEDRSAVQKIRGRVIFSENSGSLESAAYVFNDQTLKTCAIVAGEGEGEGRKIIQVGNGSGWELREVMVDARDLQKGELTEEEYQQALIQRGNEKLLEHGVVECLDAKIRHSSVGNYKTKYDLGDIVTVKKESWGISVDKRITEIQEVYEKGCFLIYLTFGNPLPDKVDLSE